MSPETKSTEAKRPRQRSQGGSSQSGSTQSGSAQKGSTQKGSTQSGSRGGSGRSSGRSGSGASGSSSARGTQSKRAASGSQSPLATVTSDLVTQMARSGAGELVKGNQPVNEVARKVVGEAVETLDKRGPELVEDAGIMNWRFALLGWATWTIGKRVLRRKAKTAMTKVTRGGDHGAGRKQLEQGS